MKRTIEEIQTEIELLDKKKNELLKEIELVGDDVISPIHQMFKEAAETGKWIKDDCSETGGSCTYIKVWSVSDTQELFNEYIYGDVIEFYYYYDTLIRVDGNEMEIRKGDRASVSTGFLKYRTYSLVDADEVMVKAMDICKSRIV